jgi:hypothetical protein
MVALSLLDVAGHVDFDADVSLDRIPQQSRKPRKVIPAAGGNDPTRGNS